MKSYHLLKTCFPLVFSAFVFAHPSNAPYQNPGVHPHVGPSNVLVIYNTAWEDGDNNGKNDSLEVAEYYANRRDIPANNILGITVSNYLDNTWKDYISYENFYSNILIPVVLKLNSTNSLTSQPFKSNIYYLCPVFGVPPDVNTYFTNAENPMGASWKNDRRSLDAFLMNPYLMLSNGLYFTNGNNRPGTASYLPPAYGNMWGDDDFEIGYGNIDTPVNDDWNKYYDDAENPADSKHFKELRDAEWPDFIPWSYGYFLVTRIDGPGKDVAIGLVDKTLYAEKYIRNWAGFPETNFYGKVYTDDDSDNIGNWAPLIFSRAIGGDIKNWFRGDSVGNAYNSVFDTNVNNTLKPWDWIEDSHASEIGQTSGAIPRIRKLRIDEINGFTASVYYANSSSSFYYYVASSILRGFEGKTFTNYTGGGAEIIKVGTNDSELAWGDIVLSSTNNFSVGNYLFYDYPENLDFPYDDAMWYSAYYIHSFYQDAFQWLPGSVGFHNESYACREFRHGSNGIFFAGKALLRGMTAIGGCVEEPFAPGIPFAKNFFRSFCQGFDFAESCYQSTPCAIAWMNVFIGDPLYNPFMSLYENSNRYDSTSPEIIVTNYGGSLIIEAKLDNFTTAQATDIAQFKLEYGSDSNNWENTFEYVDWPSASSPSWNNNRKYNWTRSYKWTFPTPTTSFFYRVSARDPYGNETVGEIKEVPIPEPGILWIVGLIPPFLKRGSREFLMDYWQNISKKSSNK